MRGLLGIVVAALVALAGCAAGGGPGEDADPGLGPGVEGDGIDVRRVVVHASEGRLLPDAAFPGEAPTFVQRMVPLVTAREPMVAATPDGVFYNGLRDHKTSVWQTTDDGRSWDPVLRNPVAMAIDGSLQYSDPFLYADPGTHRLFAANMVSTDCILVEWSDEPQAAWEWSFIGDCTQDTGLHDHQSIVTAAPRALATRGYPNVLHYCASSITDGGERMARCLTSLDGGRTFGPLVDSGLDKCSGLTGHLAAAPDGSVFLPQLACRGPGEDVEAWVAVSRDDGQGWTPTLVERRPASPEGLGVGHEGAVAADAAGNLYYLYMDDRALPRLVLSRDGGATWEPGRDVAAPGLTGCTFPSIVAGEAGRIALFCIGTTAPGGFAMAEETAGRAEWHAYVTFSLDALAADPVFATVVVNDPGDPLARGKPRGEGISVEALTAPVNSMGDFLKITLDHEGRLWVALVDECTTLCADGGTMNSPRGYGYFPGAIGVQTAGARLRA